MGLDLRARLGLNPPLTVSAVVLDCDGLLVDSEAVWRRAAAAMFAERGVGYLPEHQARLTGLTLAHLGNELAALLQTGESAAALAAELVLRVDADGDDAIAPMPGAVALVGALAARVPLGLASNGGRRHVERVLASLAVRSCFSTVVTADDVPAPKPDPAPYRLALALLGAHPSEAVAFEDSRAGAASALQAGAFVVAVPSTRGARVPAHVTIAALDHARIRRWSEAVRPIARTRSPFSPGPQPFIHPSFGRRSMTR